VANFEAYPRASGFCKKKQNVAGNPVTGKYFAVSSWSVFFLTIRLTRILCILLFIYGHLFTKSGM
jgi:hypothetical protein